MCGQADACLLDGRGVDAEPRDVNRGLQVIAAGGVVRGGSGGERGGSGDGVRHGFVLGDGLWWSVFGAACVNGSWVDGGRGRVCMDSCNQTRHTYTHKYINHDHHRVTTYLLKLLQVEYGLAQGRGTRGILAEVLMGCD